MLLCLARNLIKDISNLIKREKNAVFFIFFVKND